MRWCVLLLAASPAFAAVAPIDGFEAADLGPIHADNRGMEHPTEITLAREPEQVHAGKQSLRFHLDMTRKGSFSYCILWFRPPQPPPFPTPALSVQVKASQGALLGKFRFYRGGSPRFTSPELRLDQTDWTRLVITDWEPHPGVTAAGWQEVDQLAFLATNGNDAVILFDDLEYLSADDPAAQAAATEVAPPEAPAGLVQWQPLHGLDRVAFRVRDDLPVPHRDALELAVTVTRGGEPVINHRLVGVGDEAGSWLSLLALPPGDYQLGYRLFDGEQELEHRTVPLRVPERPEWQGNDLGAAALAPDHVLPPWEPLTAEEDTAELWGRRYRFGEAGLPRSIAAQGVELLRAPVTIQVGGQAVAGAEPHLVEQYAGKLVYGVDAQQPYGRLIAATSVEYDGLITCDLRLLPEEGAELPAMTLRIPLRGDQASAMVWQPYLASGGIIPYGGLKVDDVYDEKPGSGWVPAGDGVVWERPTTPLLWLGNLDRGLAFFVDSEAGFRPVDPRQRSWRTRLERVDGGVDLVLNLIAAPVTTDRPLHYRFGFMATPVKPHPPGWRGWRMSNRRVVLPPIAGREHGNLQVYWQEFTRRYGSLDPNLAKPEAFAAAAAEDHAHDRAVLPYYAPQWITVGVHDPIADEWTLKNPLYDTYEHEWRAVDGRRVDYPYGPPKTTVTYAASVSDNAWSDYLLWLMHEQAIRGADGYYSDCSGPTPDSNPFYGTGFTADGKRFPTFNLAATRHQLKRALQMFREVRGEDRRQLVGLGIMHGTGVSPLLVPYFDVRLDGEFERANLVDLVRRRPEVAPFFYSNLYDLETFRIQYDGRKWGQPTVFLPELRWVSDTTDLLSEETMLDPRATRDFLVFTLLTDTLVWPIWCNSDEVYWTWAVKDSFGIGGPEVELLPYWDATPAITASSPDVKVTAYRKPGGALLIVGNTAQEPRTVRLTIDAARTGIPAGANLTDGIAGGDLPADAELTLPPRDFKMLVWSAR